MKESISSEKNGHIVALTQKFSSYPNRFPVQPGTTWETLSHQNYHPEYYVSGIVLKNHTWADFEDIEDVHRNILQSYEGPIKTDRYGRPLNPRGPTGIEGRGILGKWGANFAADPIVTRINNGFLELIVIKRQDCGQWALPGGMVDKGERATATLKRELGEETSANLDFDSATLIYQGYVDDPRNTDNAWMETDAYHLHLSPEDGDKLVLSAGDDASDAQWIVCSQEKIQQLYASHPRHVQMAISNFNQKNNCLVSENGKIISSD